MPTYEPTKDRQAHNLIVDSAQRRSYNHARNVAPQQGGMHVKTILMITVIGSILLGTIARIAF
jgi:hypothetical protein